MPLYKNVQSSTVHISWKLQTIHILTERMGKYSYYEALHNKHNEWTSVAGKNIDRPWAKEIKTITHIHTVVYFAIYRTIQIRYFIKWCTFSFYLNHQEDKINDGFKSLESGYSSELGEGGEVSPGRDIPWGLGHWWCSIFDWIMFTQIQYQKEKRKMLLHLSCVLLYRHCISQLKLMEWVRWGEEKRKQWIVWQRH